MPCRWSKLNEAKRRNNWPNRKTEYLFYQVITGAWPLTSERALSFMQKAAREAKEHTQWQQPAPEYEEALQNFVKRALDDLRFVAEVKEFVSRLADLGLDQFPGPNTGEIDCYGRARHLSRSRIVGLEFDRSR